MIKRHYELMLLVHPDREDQVDAMLDRYLDVIESGDGIVHRKEIWGRMSLAYPIKNTTKGIYLLLNIECKTESIIELRKLFRFSDSILRHLIIRMDEAITEMSSFLKQKTSEKQTSSKQNFKNPDASDIDETIHGSGHESSHAEQVKNPAKDLGKELESAQA